MPNESNIALKPPSYLCINISLFFGFTMKLIKFGEKEL